MYLYGKINVAAVLPEKLKRLKDLANNLWWSWNSEAIDIYREIDLSLWESMGKNPIRFLREVSQTKLIGKLEDSVFMDRYGEVVSRFDSYMNCTDTWFARNYPEKEEHMVAYFSAEYGLHEVLPIYSGGLGVLSGDHCKAASDLGIPFTAIGIFYKQGYFSQRINHDGCQETKYTELNISQLPIEPALDSTNQQVIICVQFPGRAVYAKIWRVRVGRINLYLIDSDVEQNNSTDRLITSRLYGGDQETRIEQEILLGIGGINVLESLGIKATVYHMNEGHSAFLGLELTRCIMLTNSLSFRSALEVASSSITFTTHTPVPAGNDVFPIQMVDSYFSNYWDFLRISRHEFLDLGLKVGDNQNFNMTVLALKIAGRKNGVSELHGAVSRNIFNNVWPGIPEQEVPISHITNGVHTLTWLSPSIKYLFDKYLENDWKERLYEKEVWNKIDDIPDQELWDAHRALKTKMIDFVRDNLRQQRIKNDEPTEIVSEAHTLLDYNALTIGFARRFATYKRANLIFRDVARIQKILNNPEMPIQIIFAGKAHPADGPAQDVIQNINNLAKQEGFKGKVVLLENYNMTLARNLVQGVDIWLNNPKRPLEASGTSGQKVCINGIVNFSVLDGWWCEGYNGKNGWAIGDGIVHADDNFQDTSDSDSLYSTLEKKIIPLFYLRDERGVPTKWLSVMKESMKSLIYKYSTHRMVQDYVSMMYVPSMDRINKVTSNNFALANELSEWKQNMEKSWSQIAISAEKTMNNLKVQNSISGEYINFTATVMLGDIDPSNVLVEIYYGPVNQNDNITNAQTKAMTLVEKTSSDTYLYKVDIDLIDGGEYHYTFRVLPYHTDLINVFNMGLIQWIIN